MNKKVRNGILAYSWTSFTILLSSIPNHSLPKTFLQEIFGIDKLGHLVFYALMLILWTVYIVHFTSKRKAMIYSTLISFFIGLALELMQKYVFTDRDFDYFDLAANGIGIAVGIFLILKFDKLFSIFVKPTN